MSKEGTSSDLRALPQEVKLYEGDHLVVALDTDGRICIDAEDTTAFDRAALAIEKLTDLSWECLRARVALERFGRQPEE